MRTVDRWRSKKLDQVRREVNDKMRALETSQCEPLYLTDSRIPAFESRFAFQSFC